MHQCDNCSAAFDSHRSGLLVTSGGAQSAAICDACCQGARKVKLVLARGQIGRFSYEQFSAIEMAKVAG